ncbi:helix-turn-helix domain-containing protein [Streptomyces peucetius]|uniref:Helix-turn-helix domain-containing protein n=1 Tax=Streptomyces peucetius TaxID=1950 RepID=A0ABY6IHL7_STRPE|nr:helix-turn-helix domain-containing protein [Streptomyces peucetius]UYQ66508.1 helix-turn-helix domain-containing protein [Streptomyces peucetius]
MDTQQISAPSRASYRVPGRATAFGVIHVNSIHTTRFTIVGNHLAQHGQLSLTAIGLAVHIQSLPDGAKVGIKVLADRFPESEARIAAALRELEEHSYLARMMERLPGGKLVTRTISYNHPEAAAATPAPAPCPPPVREPEPEPVPEPAPAPTPPPTRPPLPQPQAPDLERHRVATDLLAGLRRDEPRLLLGEHDVHRLAPAVAAWLERDAAPDAVRHALTANLPDPLKQPAALLAHRLTALLPPPLPAQAPPSPPRAPLQNCDKCDRAFRAPAPGECRECRTDDLATAA